MKKDFEKLFNEIVEWQNETFPDATALSKVSHLQEEVMELFTEIALNNGPCKSKRQEFADCFMLLIGAASDSGFSYIDIYLAIEEKMEINKKRKWSKPDANGVVHHIKE